ncbi:MAG: hypothetical protein ACKVZ0_16990 [Gemmatimonadales bacterium]
MAVLDANEQEIVLVDFRGATTGAVGRIGSGPREYRFVRRLLDLGGDSLGVEDQGNQRLLVITSAGRVGGLLGPTGAPLPKSTPLRGPRPTAGDGRGYLYALNFSPFAPGAAARSDSAPIERWKLGSSVRDTIAYLPLHPNDPRQARAFGTLTQWVVDRAGRLAIVSPDPFVVTFVNSSGRRTHGPTIRFSPIPVSELHRRQWREDLARPRPVLILVPGGAAPRPGLRAAPVDAPISWPSRLPAFLEEAARFGPDGVLWVQRTTPADRPPIFDLIDGRGMVVERVSIPARTRLVGFGRGHLYLARVDPDNVEFLERYKLTPRGKP